MATSANTVTQRTLILKNCFAAPDHNHTIQYTAGEIYMIGDVLMPAPLSVILVNAGFAAEDNIVVTAPQLTVAKTKKAKYLDGDSPQGTW